MTHFHKNFGPIIFEGQVYTVEENTMHQYNKSALILEMNLQVFNIEV